MSPYAAGLAEALTALQFITGWSGGWTPFERRREDAVRAFWRPAMAPGLPDLIQGLGEFYEDEIAFGLPQPKRFNGGVGNATILWAQIESGLAFRRALTFRPLPTIVLREGPSLRRLAIWALEQPTSYSEVFAANKRLAYRFGARQCVGDPDRLMISCPGSMLRLGKVKPVPIVCTRLSTDTFTSRAVTGSLADPPVTDWWETKGRRA